MYFNGDVNEHKDVDLYPEKSYLFFLTRIIIERYGIKLIGEVSSNLGKAVCFFRHVQCVQIDP